MKKISIKLIFVLNTLIYWVILFKAAGFLVEEVLFDVFPAGMVALNMIFIVCIFVVLLPMSMFLTHQIFKFIRDNYNYSNNL